MFHEKCEVRACDTLFIDITFTFAYFYKSFSTDGNLSMNVNRHSFDFYRSTEKTHSSMLHLQFSSVSSFQDKLQLKTPIISRFFLCFHSEMQPDKMRENKLLNDKIGALKFLVRLSKKFSLNI